jgi:hypothetical protein
MGLFTIYSKNSGDIVRDWAFLALGGLALCLASCDHATESVPTQSYKLEHFSQEITSPVDKLSLSVNQSIQVPVTIKNPSTDTWFAEGQYPIHISYKWFNGSQMLPIEGERTALAAAHVLPNESVQENIHIVAPGAPGVYQLQITLVQEAVAWFNLAGAKPLVIAATVR